jgi:hypothetical protein
MKKITEQEREKALILIDHIYYGESNAKHTKELTQIFGWSNRDIRRIIFNARQLGFPICSNTQSGYWAAKDEDELHETIKRLENERNGLNASIRALKKCKKGWDND